MKFGLIVYKNTDNIGDDIQSYAAIKYLPKIDYYIEREEMDSFVPKKEESVAVIMNGWFLHNDYSWPPSPFLKPLLISIHFANRFKDELPSFLDNTGLDYLKKYQPIGLRDDLIKKHLENENIQTFFSSCLTTTIKPFEKISEKDHICLVDVPKDIENLVSKSEKVKIFTHELDPKVNSKLSWNKRFKNVENLLKEYQSSKLVITTRLHCALPCLAIGVPVLLIYDSKNEDHKNRLSKFVDFTNSMSKEDFLGKAGKNFLEKIPNNPQKFKDFLPELDNRIMKFIEDNKNKKGLLKGRDSIYYYKKYYLKRKNRAIPFNHNQKIEFDLKEKELKRLNIVEEDFKREYKWLNIEIDNLKKTLESKEKDIAGLISEIEKLNTVIYEKTKKTKKSFFKKSND